MDKLYEAQLALHKKIANSFANFKVKGKASMTRGAAKAHLEGLEAFFNSFRTNHTSILALEAFDENHQYFTDGVYDIVEETYFDNKGDFCEFLEVNTCRRG